MLLFGCFLVPVVFALTRNPSIDDHYMQKSNVQRHEWLDKSISESLDEKANGPAKLLDKLLPGGSVYNIRQALFACRLLLDVKRNETESQGIVGNVESVKKKEESNSGPETSDRSIAQSDSVPGMEKYVRAELCIHQRCVVSLEVLLDKEVPRNHCTEVKVNLNRHSVSLRRFGISSFAQGWYRLQGLPINFLDLSSNDIANITSEILNDLPADLSSVSLADNQIERLEKGVIINKNLRRFNLENNFISYIADEALQGTKLSSFFLSVNQLTDTRFVASLPSTLRELILQENRVGHILPRSFANLNDLEILNVAQNNITAIRTESLHGLSSLKRLILEENNLKTIEPGSFDDLKALIFLNLHRNNLTSLERGIFENLKTLEFLDLGLNKFRKIIPEFLRGLSDTLQELVFDFNQIESLESGTFVDVPRYRLSLRGNKITTIKKGSFNLPHLQELNLEENSLSILNAEAFEGLENLSHLILKKNCIKQMVNFFFWRNQTLQLKSRNTAVFFDCQQRESPPLKCQ